MNIIICDATQCKYNSSNIGNAYTPNNCTKSIVNITVEAIDDEAVCSSFEYYKKPYKED